MIRDQWYALCEDADIGDRPVALRRLGMDLVLWRDRLGVVRATADRCPHKGARLSDGRVQQGELACPYHGFRFDGAGRCTAIPVQPDRPIPAAMCLHTLPLQVAHGLVWLWHGESAPEGEVPWFDDCPADSPTASSSAMVYPVHYSRMVESNFDVYHFPFVHRSLDPGLGAEVVDLEVHAEPSGAIRTSGAMRNAAGRKTAFRIDFLPPNLQRIQLTDKVVGVIVCTPIDERHTWAWARYDQTLLRLPVLGRALSALLLYFEWTVVQRRQDVPVLSQLDPREAAPGACVWVHADAGAARYVQWRARQLRAQEEARAATPLREVGA